MAWYTTDHARRDAERQATRRQQAGLLDKAQSSKQVTRFECIHCRAIYRPTDEQCPRCGAFEAARCKTPNVIYGAKVTPNLERHRLDNALVAADMAN